MILTLGNNDPIPSTRLLAFQFKHRKQEKFSRYYYQKYKHYSQQHKWVEVYHWLLPK